MLWHVYLFIKMPQALWGGIIEYLWLFIDLGRFRNNGKSDSKDFNGISEYFNYE